MATRNAALVIGGFAASALAINLIVWLIGLALGGTFQFIENGEPHTTTAPQGVISMTTIPMVAGLTLAYVIADMARIVVRIAQFIGTLAPLATVSMTLSAGFDTASVVALSAMHVVIAGHIPIALETLGRRLSILASAESAPQLEEVQ